MEAFAAIPASASASRRVQCASAAWSPQEQSSTAKPQPTMRLDRTANGNAAYEERFGFTYIVCATGKSAEEMLRILHGASQTIAPQNCRRPQSSSGRSCNSLEKVVTGMSGITTHVLDTSLGKPAAGVAVRLEKHDEDSWLVVAESATDHDGRCRNLAARGSPGVLPAHLCHRRAISSSSSAQSIYPELLITFQCSGEAHYHLPLLLSDNSYTTYRGS